jgi:hypothetical protein
MLARGEADRSSAIEQALGRLVRVIDESGEDYLYPRGLFVAVDLPLKLTRQFAAAT